MCKSEHTFLPFISQETREGPRCFSCSHSFCGLLSNIALAVGLLFVCQGHTHISAYPCPYPLCRPLSLPNVKCSPRHRKVAGPNLYYQHDLTTMAMPYIPQSNTPLISSFGNHSSRMFHDKYV